MRFRFEPVPDFIDQFDKLTRKDRALRERAIKKIDQILTNPEIGEPKRYRLKMARGVHVNPFVIVYMIVGDKIVFLWFDHHDQAYDKAASILEKTASDYPYLLRHDYRSKGSDKDR
jgi:mRNA-degrading endonuclease RelE of RelBE toxin-antitoxin system